MDILKPK